MTPLSPIGTALYGLKESLKAFDETATRIVRQAGEADPAEDLAGLKIAKAGVQANVRVVQATDELVGSILDALR